MMPLLVVALTVLGVGGVLVAVLPGADVPEHLATRQQSFGRGAAVQLAIGLGAGAVVVVASGWILPAVAVGVAGWWVAGRRGDRRRDRDERVARVDAVASWIEHLRDVLVAGEQPVGAIVSTVGTCPPPIRPAVRRLAVGLGRQDPELVLRRFADDLDDPIGDLVATGLLIAIRRGARTVPVLTSLAEQARAQADRRRLVEAERAPTRREVTALSSIMALLLGALLLLGRSDYLDAYDTTGGQVFLTAALALYGGLLLRVRALARFPQPGRFLSAGAAPS
jgi:hypothetical protein